MVFNIDLEYVVRTDLESNIKVKIQENTKKITIRAYANDTKVTLESKANLKTKTLDLIEKVKKCDY